MINSPTVSPCRPPTTAPGPPRSPPRRWSRPSSGSPAVRVDGDHLYWLESHPEQGGRVGLWRQPLARWRTDRGHPGPGLRPQPGVRVRRRRVRSPRRSGRLHRARRRPGLPGRRRRADADHAGGTLPLRRPPPAPGPRPRAGRPGGPLRRTASRCTRSSAWTSTGPNADGGTVLCAGADFYATPELSAAGRLAWTEWNHPDMPWDASTVMVGHARPGRRDRREVRSPAARASRRCSRAGWATSWSCCRTGPAGGTSTVTDGDQLRPLHDEDAEFGVPQWTLGQSPYAVLDDDHLFCTVNRSGRQSLAILTRVDRRADAGGRPRRRRPGGRHAVSAAPQRSWPTPTGRRRSACSTSAAGPGRRCAARPPATLPPEAVSVAEPVSWSSPRRPGPRLALPADQPRLHRTARPPAAAAGDSVTAGRPDSPPPRSCSPTSSGPAGATRSSTSTTAAAPASGARTGNGCAGDGASSTPATASAARRPWSSRAGRTRERLVIRGGSAGGYTTLRALTSTEIFAAGISLYGVGDLEALAKDTHKFESRYLDGLVGPYPEVRADLPRPFPDQPLRPAGGTDPAAAGHRGPGRAADPDRDDGRRPPGPRAFRWR